MTRKNDDLIEKIPFKRSRGKPGFKLLILSLSLIVFVLSLVLVVRLVQHKPLFPVGESYYNLRLAQELKQNPLLIEDPVQNTPYQPNPYHYLLAMLLLMLSPSLVSIITPILLGLISAIIFFKLLTLLGIRYEDAAYSLMILAVSPAFINLFTGLYLYGFVLFLSLLIIFLVIISKKSKYTLALSSLLLLVLTLTSLIGFIITIVFLLIICLALKRKARTVIIPSFPSIIALVFLAFFSIYKPALLGFHSFEFRNILSVLGADLGYDLFLILLFFAGFIIVWSRNDEKRLLQLVVLIFFVISFFNSVARAYSSLIITFYCVTAIKYFYNRKWELEIIRTGTLLLILSSLVFSLTSQVNLLVSSQPDKEIENSLLFLKELDAGIVFSAEDIGFVIEFYSGKQVLFDQNSFLNLNYNEAKNDTARLFLTPRLSEAEPIFRKYNIRYIFITPEMKQEIWSDRQEGLWFLVENSDSFVRKYEYASIELWEYAPGRRT